MTTIKTSINLKESVSTEVDLRGEHGEANRSGVISRDLERYYESLKRARADLRKKFSGAEVSAIVENLKGVWMGEPVSISLLIWATVADAIDLNRLDKRWKIDGKALVEKIRSLSFIEICALADAAERHWYNFAQGDDLKSSEALKD